MVGPQSFDPDFTSIDLDQTFYQGGSGTLVSDEELICASGQIRTDLTNLIVNTSGVLANQIPSGLEEFLSEIDIGVFSQVINNPFKTLPLAGDDTDTTPQTVLGVPVARQAKNNNNFTAWNLRAPIGGTSGFNFTFRWMPENGGTGSIIYRMSFKNLPSGVTLDSISSVTATTTLTEAPGGPPWVQRFIYQNTINFAVTIASLEAFSINFQRLGATDTFNRNTFLLSAAINFNPDT